MDARVAEAPADDMPAPLDTKAALSAGRQAVAVARLDIDEAAQIYSQNCYDKLEEKFDWTQADRCGAFDSVNARWAASDGMFDASAYFGQETAAARYIASATKHNLHSSLADQRWEDLKSATKTFKRPVAKPVAAVEGDPDEEFEPSVSNGPALAVEAATNELLDE